MVLLVTKNTFILLVLNIDTEQLCLAPLLTWSLCSSLENPGDFVNYRETGCYQGMNICPLGKVPAAEGRGRGTPLVPSPCSPHRPGPLGSGNRSCRDPRSRKRAQQTRDRTARRAASPAFTPNDRRHRVLRHLILFSSKSSTVHLVSGSDSHCLGLVVKTVHSKYHPFCS